MLHTHAEPGDKDAILTPLLGNPHFDGLSFQVGQRETVFDEVALWRNLASASGHDWVITMDEIGEWHTGATLDADDPLHDTLRQQALWGALLSGASGVEWYFGAQSSANDLTTEDWRGRAELWRQTRVAMDILEKHVEWWTLTPCTDDDTPGTYCAEDSRGRRVMYLVSGSGLKALERTGYSIFNPITGGELASSLNPFDKDVVVIWN